MVSRTLTRLATELALAAALALGAACGGVEIVAPAGVAGRYVLRTVDGSPLPYTLSSVPPRGETYAVLADTVHLGRSGRARLAEVTRLRRTGAPAIDTVFHYTGVRTFTLEDDSVLYIAPPPCPKNVVCDDLPPPRMIVGGGWLTSTEVYAPRRVRRYERVGP